MDGILAHCRVTELCLPVVICTPGWERHSESAVHNTTAPKGSNLEHLTEDGKVTAPPTPILIQAGVVFIYHQAYLFQCIWKQHFVL